MTQCLYMNNSGHRWTFREPEPRRFYLLRDGVYTLRTADFFEAVGNWSAVCFRVAGKRYSRFPETFETHNGLPIVKF